MIAENLKLIAIKWFISSLSLLLKKCKVVKCEMPVEGKAKLEKDQAGQ